MKDGTNSCVKNDKKREKLLTLFLLLQLVYHSVKWECLSDCWFWIVTKNSWMHVPPRLDLTFERCGASIPKLLIFRFYQPSACQLVNEISNPFAHICLTLEWKGLHLTIFVTFWNQQSSQFSKQVCRGKKVMQNLDFFLKLSFLYLHTINGWSEGIMFFMLSVKTAYSCKCNISRMPWVSFFLFATNVHLNSRINRLDFGDQRSKHISGHFSFIWYNNHDIVVHNDKMMMKLWHFISKRSNVSSVVT